MNVTIRDCRPDDAQTLADLIRALAVYERLEDQARANPDDLRRNLFGPRPFAESILAEIDGAAVGYALFFPTYSTFRGQPGLFLEDLFVLPEHRGRGIGKILMTAVAAKAVARGSGRLEWAVLRWNTPSLAFYRSLGALPLDDWITYRMTDEPLAQLAAKQGLTTESTEYTEKADNI